MLQILGLRTFVPKDGKNKGKETIYDAFHERGWRAPSLANLLASLEEYLKPIPQQERWNLFYTVANCKEKKREFDFSSILPFDIDGVSPGVHQPYTELIAKILGIDPAKTGIVNSGNGLHYLVELDTPIKSRVYYEENRCHYRALVTKINIAIIDAGLEGKADPAVFDARRLLRLPGTTNVKKNKPSKDCVIINSHMKPQPIDLKSLSGLPVVKKEDQLPAHYLKRYPNIDSKSVLQGCRFLSWCKSNQADITEPAWYMMLSILGRLEDGHRLAHEYSCEHPSYTAAGTDQKLEQSLEASGPRTCKNIASEYSSCVECPHFQKITSPIQIVGDDYIKTASTGFHQVIVSSNGAIKTKPCYEDLRRFFEKEHPYKGLDSSRMAHIWDGKRWVYMKDIKLEEYAQEKFNPTAETFMVQEFRNLVCRTNVTNVDWFQEGVVGKINFSNGILDLRTGVLGAHDPECGFRYVLPYSYDESATCPIFDEMMKHVTCGDNSLTNILLEFMAYALSNDPCWAQKALLLVGDGANGKSTFLSVLEGLAGPDNYSSLNISDINRSEYNLQLLDGKLFNISDELNIKAIAKSSVFKTLVTGGRIQARMIYKNPYFVENRAKLIISCNELPEAMDNTYGFYRRLMIVPFNHRFSNGSPGYDPEIGLKLKAELPGVFNHVWEAWKRLKLKFAFSESKTVARVMEDYVLDTNTVKSWVKDNLKIIPIERANGHWTAIRDLYDTYRMDSESYGKQPLSMTGFSKGLSQLVDNYGDRSVLKKVEKKIKRGLTGVVMGDGLGLDENFSIEDSIN